MNRKNKVLRVVKASIPLLALLVLAGCSGGFYDSRMRGYVPEYPEEKFPIEVVKGAVNLRLPVVSGKLTDKERLAVRRLAQQASSLTSPVIIIRPPKSVKAEVMAAEITRELVDFGINPQRLVHRTNGAPGEVRISFHRKFAVTKECGDWSKPLNETAMNSTYPNFGCAQQFNIAAQVDNPEDFERPRVMTPPDSDVRNRAMEKYRKGEDYTSQWPGGVKIRINEGIKASVQK